MSLVAPLKTKLADQRSRVNQLVSIVAMFVSLFVSTTTTTTTTTTTATTTTTTTTIYLPQRQVES